MTHMTVIGFEAMSGVGKTSGKAYSIGRLHTAINLAPPTESGIAKGQMGTTYDCPEILVRKIAHIPTPCVVDVTTEDQIKFGKRETIVSDLRPVSVETKKVG